MLFTHLMRRSILLTIICLAFNTCVSFCFAQSVRQGNVRISLKASPTFLPADGKSRARILIELRDRSNKSMPDGTPIFCFTDLGLLSTSETDKLPSLTVLSQNGYATIYCSSDVAGPAKVTIKVQDSSNDLALQFLPEGVNIKGELRVVTISGGWVAYSPDAGTIQARDSAVATIGSLQVTAVDGLEIDVERQTLRACSVEVKRGDQIIHGEDMFYELAVGRGVIRRFGENGLERIYFTAYELLSCPTTWEVPEGAFRSRELETETWIVCDECKFFLGERIVLKKPALYAADKRIMKLPPIWVIGLSGYYGASNSQVLGLSSDGGLAVDLPFFYRVTDKWSGSVRIQKGAGGSSFMSRDGWALGIGEEYDSGDVQGNIELSGIGNGDWGIGWEDERTILGDAQSYLSVMSPDHKSLFADANTYYYAENYRLNVRSQFDRPVDEGIDFNFAVDALTEPQCISGPATYRLGTSVGVRRTDLADKQWNFENELYAGFDLGTRKIGSKTSVNIGLSNVYSWDTDDYAANSARGEVRLAYQFNQRTRWGVNYHAIQRNGDTSRPGLSHLLGSDFNWSSGNDWFLAANGTWDATSDDTYAFASLNKYFRRGWRTGVSATHYNTFAQGYDDVELSLGKSIAGREIGLRYSFESGRVSLEMGSFFGN